MLSNLLTLFRMDIFSDAHDGRPKRSLLPKICHTHPTTVIAYLKEIQKHLNHVKYPRHSAEISLFSPEISNFCYIKKY